MSLAAIVEFINNHKALCSVFAHLILGISGSWAYHFICVYRKEKEKITFSDFFGYPCFLTGCSIIGALAGIAFSSTTFTRISLIKAFFAGFSSVAILDQFGDKIIKLFGEFLDQFLSKKIVDDAHEKSVKLLEDLEKQIQELKEIGAGNTPNNKEKD